MVIDTLRGLSLHGPGSPPAFQVPSVEEFTTYDTWLRAQTHFVGGSETVDADAEDYAKVSYI